MIDASDQTDITDPVIHNVALCLSGGGYRAAAFHLGVLKTLEELNFLDKAKYLSTASGGTITAMKYVIAKLEKKSFDEFYNQTCNFLRDINVVKEAFQILETTPSPGDSGNLSLIRSAAEVYRRKLIEIKTSDNSPSKKWTIKDLRDDVSGKKIFHDLIFNSTEFRTGDNFRFRAANRDVLFGNKNTPVREEFFEQISLADVVASSSCFPGVFEPIRFPEDFQLAERNQSLSPFLGGGKELKSIALMDGGIVDNQGLYGMTISYKDEKTLPFQLMIVSDTTPRGSDDLLKYDIKPRKAGVAIKNILRLCIGLLCFLIFCTLTVFARLIQGQIDLSLPDTLLFGFVGLVLLIISSLALFSILWGLSKIKLLKIMGANFPIWNYLKNLSTGDIFRLLAERLSSAEALIFNVFMERIRSLQFGYTMSAIARDTRNNLFNGKTVFVNIYDLDPMNNYNGVQKLNPILKPTPLMMEICRQAESVETKLWLSKKELDYLSDCGRITVCYSLLKFFWEDAKSKTLPEPDIVNSQFFNIYEKWLELKKEFS